MSLVRLLGFRTLTCGCVVGRYRSGDQSRSGLRRRKRRRLRSSQPSPEPHHRTGSRRDSVGSLRHQSFLTARRPAPRVTIAVVFPIPAPRVSIFNSVFWRAPQIRSDVTSLRLGCS